MNGSMNRRGFFKAALVLGGAAVLSPLSGSLAGSARAASTERNGRGMVTLTFDDALRSVHVHALPILREQGLTGTVGVIAERMDWGDPDFLGAEELSEMAEAGFEIASHSLTHKRPVDIPRYYEEEALGTPRRVRGQAAVFEVRYRHQGLAGVLVGGKRLRERASEQAVVDEPGTYFFDELISEIVFQPYRPEDIKVAPAMVISYQREMEESKRLLTDRGFSVTTFITPHNYWTPDMAELSKRYYAQVAAGGDASNSAEGFDVRWLKRRVVHSDHKVRDITAWIEDEVVKQGGWLILCLHGVGEEVGWEPWPAERLRGLAKWLTQNGIKVVTVEEGTRIMERLSGRGQAGKVS